MFRKAVKLKISCRMCGKNFVNKPLFMLHQKYKQLEEYPINIIQKYHIEYFKIFENDGLPQQICEKCLEDFKTINEFIETRIKIQDKLKIDFPDHKLDTLKTELSHDEPKETKYGDVHNEAKQFKNDILKGKNAKIRNVLKEKEIKDEKQFKRIINDDVTIKAENLYKIDNDFENNSNIASDNNDHVDMDTISNNSNDNDNSEEEYFNDNFIEDFTINCQFCQKEFNNIFDLDAHELNKHKMKLYNKFILCEICGEPIRHYRFNEHLQGIHEGKKLYNCEDCGKDFQKFRAFKEHSIKYHQSDRNQINYDDKEKYPCPECNRVYLSQGMLRNHMKNIHSGMTSKSLSKNKNQRQKPLITTTPITFQCDICKIKFRNIVSMEKHRNNHVNEKYEHKFECPQCDRRFGRRDHLKYHIKLEHLKDKPFKCQQCDKSYVIGFQLNTHMKTVHSNDKTSRRARCDNCNKTFHNKRYLLRHQKEIHSYDAQFACVICNEKFFKHVHLIKHSQIHNIEKTEEIESTNLHEDEENELNESTMSEIVNYSEIEDTDKKNHIDNEIEMAVSLLMKAEDDI